VVISSNDYTEENCGRYGKRPEKAIGRRLFKTGSGNNQFLQVDNRDGIRLRDPEEGG
jgi:hypothetical protein